MHAASLDYIKVFQLYCIWTISLQQHSSQRGSDTHIVEAQAYCLPPMELASLFKVYLWVSFVSFIVTYAASTSMSLLNLYSRTLSVLLLSHIFISSSSLTLNSSSSFYHQSYHILCIVKVDSVAFVTRQVRVYILYSALKFTHIQRHPLHKGVRFPYHSVSHIDHYWSSSSLSLLANAFIVKLVKATLGPLRIHFLVDWFRSSHTHTPLQPQLLVTSFQSLCFHT